MKASIGRALQLVGLTLIGFGFVVGLVKDDLRYEEKMFFAGCGVFLVGWLLGKGGKA